MKITKWNPDTIPEADKCYSNMPNSVYHGLVDWYGSTMIKRAIRSGESFFYEISQPPKQSMAFERGHALHAGIEGLTIDGTMDLFEDTILESPTKTISKAWQTLKNVDPEKAILPENEIENVRVMLKRLFHKASDAGYYDQGWPELSFFWIDEETGLQLKCRLDWLRVDGEGWVLDYKTSKAHSRSDFPREVANYHYHLSASMYLEGVRAVTGIDVENWHFLVVANTPPFEVESYALDAESLAEGYALFRKCLADIKNYDPEAGMEPRAIGLPRYAFKLTDGGFNQ